MLELQGNWALFGSEETAKALKFHEPFTAKDAEAAKESGNYYRGSMRMSVVADLRRVQRRPSAFTAYVADHDAGARKRVIKKVGSGTVLNFQTVPLPESHNALPSQRQQDAIMELALMPFRGSTGSHSRSVFGR